MTSGHKEGDPVRVKGWVPARYEEGDPVRIRDWVPVYGGVAGRVSRITRAGGKTIVYVVFAEGGGNFFSEAQIEPAWGPRRPLP